MRNFYICGMKKTILNIEIKLLVLFSVALLVLNPTYSQGDWGKSKKLNKTNKKEAVKVLEINTLYDLFSNFGSSFSKLALYKCEKRKNGQGEMDVLIGEQVCYLNPNERINILDKLDTNLILKIEFNLNEVRDLLGSKDALERFFPQYDQIKVSEKLIDSCTLVNVLTVFESVQVDYAKRTSNNKIDEQTSYLAFDYSLFQKYSAENGVTANEYYLNIPMFSLEVKSIEKDKTLFNYQTALPSFTILCLNTQK